MDFPRPPLPALPEQPDFDSPLEHFGKQFKNVSRIFKNNPIEKIIRSNKLNNNETNVKMALIHAIQQIEFYMKEHLYPMKKVNNFLAITSSIEHQYLRPTKLEKMLSTFINNPIEDFYATKFLCEKLECVNIQKILCTFDFLNWNRNIFLRNYCADNNSHKRVTSMILMIELASIFAFTEFILENNLQLMFQYHAGCIDIMDIHTEYLSNGTESPITDYVRFGILCEKIRSEQTYLDTDIVPDMIIDFINKLIDRHDLINNIGTEDVKLLTNYIDTYALFSNLDVDNIKHICKCGYYFFHHKFISHVLATNNEPDENETTDSDIDFEPVPQTLDLDCRTDIKTEFPTNIIEI